MDRYLEVRRIFDLIASAIPLDGWYRLSNDATLESDELALGALDVFQQLSELWRNVAGSRYGSVA